MLLGWESSNKITFSISPDDVKVSTSNLPVLFKLSATFGKDNTNLSYVFDLLASGSSSYVNRHKIAISQIVGREEHQLFIEIVSWDHFNKQAYMWVRTLNILKNENTLFNFYWNKHLPDNTNYVATTGNTTDVTTLVTSTTELQPFAVIKQQAYTQLWYLQNSINGFKLFNIETNNGTIWTPPEQVLTEENLSNGTISNIEGLFRMWYGSYEVDGGVYYRESLDGKTWQDQENVLTTKSTIYSKSFILNPCVTYINGIYTMLVTGLTDSTYTVLYTTSDDGKAWQALIKVIDTEEINIPNIIRFETTNLSFNNGLYTLTLNILDSSGNNDIVISNSKDCISWSKFSYFASKKEYDSEKQVSVTSLLNTVESTYDVFWGGKHGTTYNLLKAESPLVDNPVTPAEAVWFPEFYCVQHMDFDRGIIDSSCNNLNQEDYFQISPTTDDIGGQAISLDSQQSFINLGNSYRFNGKLESNAIMLSVSMQSNGTVIEKQGSYSLNLGSDLECVLSTSIGSKTMKLKGAYFGQWSVYSFGKERHTCMNCNFVTSAEGGYSAECSPDVSISNSDVVIGSNTNSSIVSVNELWFSYSILDTTKVFLLEKALKDNLFNKSSYYIQGYTTLLGTNVPRTVVSYNTSNGALVGQTTSSVTDGYYYLESTYSGTQFVIGLDGGLYNHYILGNITPRKL